MTSEAPLGLWRRHGRTIALYLGLLVLVAVCSSSQRGFIFDDPFIFFRYARNLFDGHGWVYNIGHPGFDGATSPLYVLVLSAGYGIDHNLVAVSQWIFVLALSGTAMATHATLARLGHWSAGALAAMLVATSPWLFISRGMETALFLLFFSLALYFAVAGQQWALGAALALAILTRPDGVVMALVVLGWIVWSTRRLPWRALVTLAAIGLAWLIYAETVIGALIPGTLAAKMAQGRSGLFNAGFWEGIWVIPRGYHFALVELAVGLLAVIGVWASRRRHELRDHLVVVGVSGVGLYLAYSLLDVPRYTWYFAPLVYAACVLAGVGGEWLIGWVKERRVVYAVVAALAIVTLLPLGVAATPVGPPRPGYVAAARWLRSTATSATVASAEIGILGWYSGRTMVDYDGLLNAATIPALQRGDLTWWVDALKPDYWMVRHPAFLEDVPVLTAPWFHQVFARVYSNAEVTIYRRIGLAPRGPISLLTTKLRRGLAGRPYWDRLAADGSGGPYQWSVQGSLPPGLHLSSGVVDFTHGFITGTPTQPGRFHFAVRVCPYHSADARCGVDNFTLGIKR